jgi:VWFA-related protein
VTVVDGSRKPVTGLTVADFSLKEGGKDREIASVEPAREKMRVALMLEQPLATQGLVRAALAEFVTRMAPLAEVSLILVTFRNETIIDYTSDVKALIAGINALPLSNPRQGTTVPEGVSALAKYFEKTRPARPVIVLLALEAEQESSEDPSLVLKQLARSRVRFSVVTVQTGSQGSTDVTELVALAGRARVIGDGSRQTGGLRLHVGLLTGIPDALKEVADDLSNQYLITYMLPNGVRASDRLSVTVKKPGLSVRAPSKIPTN